MSLNSKITEPEITFKGVMKDLWEMIRDDEHGRILYIYMLLIIPITHFMIRNPLFVSTPSVHFHVVLGVFQFMSVLMLLGCSIQKANVKSHEKLRISSQNLIEAYEKRHDLDNQRIILLTNTLKAYQGNPTEEVHADGVRQ